MNIMSIGKVAQEVGIQASTIRYYESIGLLPAPRRVNGIRRYEDSVLQKLGVIQLAQQAGFTISEIQTLLHDFPDDTPPSVRWQALATRKIAEIDAMIARATTMKTLLEQALLQCQCEQL